MTSYFTLHALIFCARHRPPKHNLLFAGTAEPSENLIHLLTAFEQIHAARLTDTVVCSSSSSLPAVAGDAALLCDPLDTDALTDALRRLLADRDLAETLKAGGLAQAGRFSWARTAAETLVVHKQVWRW